MKKLLMRKLTPDEKEPASKRRQVDIDLTQDNCTKSTDESEPRWLLHDHIELFLEDKEIVISGDWLTDKHINYAQSLIKKQYQNSMSGLSSSYMVHRTTITSPDATELQRESLDCCNND